MFVANDAMALVVMDVLRHQGGLSIPDDIGIVGYDDIDPAGWLSYHLTTYRQPADEMVSQTVQLLMSHIEQKMNNTATRSWSAERWKIRNTTSIQKRGDNEGV